MSESFHAVRVSTPGDLNTVSVDLLPLPVLLEDEVLVHMEYSTINPSDYLAALGRYPHGSPPYTIGLEGSGTVVKSGEGTLSASLLSKRVAVRGNGTWAEYSVAKANSVFPLLDSTSFEQAANLVVNPMTVALFYDKIQQGGHTAAVQNAAASALGKMMVKLCKSKGIPLVNLVRRQEQVDILREIGAEHVFNTSEEGWKQGAREICKSLGVSVAFDAIAGEATSDAADLISDRGVVYNYGRLSGAPASIGSLHLIFQQKRLEGLWLTSWIEQKSYEDRVKVGEFVQSNLEIFATERARVINLNQVKDALLSYSETSATNNKIVIRTRVE